MKMSACMFAALLGSTNVLAQGYPSKPLRLIVPFPVGTAPDIIGRVVAQGMGAGLGQPVLVENRPSAGGILGTAAAAAALPDGYTLHLATTGSLAIGPARFPNAGFDPVRSFAPISQISTAAVVLAVAASVPVASARELVDYSLARPGKLNYGSPGNGTIPHILMEMFKSLTGADLVHVAYKSPADVNVAMDSGDVVAMMETPATATPRQRAGKIKVLAVTGTIRHADHPNVPTMTESGVSRFDASVWYGLVAPRGTPDAIVARLNAEVQRMLRVEDVRERLAQLGNDAAASTPEAFAIFIAEQVETWRRAIRTLGTRVE